VTSTIGWLDASAAEQRRVQEIVRMFSQSETVDELGGRQAFVAIADELFPGTSVLQSRARYLIFIPWLCRRAAANPNPRAKLDRLERTLIGKFLEDDTVDAADRLTGLIGREAGPKVKQLPSTAYWSGLTRWEILQRPGTISDALLSTTADLRRRNDAEELADRVVSTWHPGVGVAPKDFLDGSIDGGFELRTGEAAWLLERWQRTAEGSLLTHLAESEDPLTGAAAPWLEPAAADAPARMRAVLLDAERFSLALEGGQRLYRLLVAEEYLRAGLQGVPVDLDAIRSGIDAWVDRAAARHQLFDGWDTAEFWSFLRSRNPRISIPTEKFFDAWFGTLRRQAFEGLADDTSLRDIVDAREVALKKPSQSRLKNPKMLAAWRGNEPPLITYRWAQVCQLVNDVHRGLGVVDVRP